MKNKRFLALFSLAVLLFLAAISFFMGRGLGHFRPEKITVGIEPTDNSLLLGIAKEKGFFERHRLEVDFKEYKSGLAALEGSLRGESDLATVSELAFASKGLEDKDLRIISSIAGATGIGEVIARRDRGISHPTDLKGKRIGVAMRTSTGYFLSSFLIFNRLSWEDVLIMETPPDQWVEAISKGVVDAVVVRDQYAHEIRKRLGDSVVGWPAQNADIFHWLLVGKKEWIEAGPGRLDRLLKALLDAEEYVRTNPVGAKEFLMSRWKRDSAYLQNIWPKLRYAVSLDQSLLSVMEDLARWNVRIGILKNQFQITWTLSMPKDWRG